MTDPSPDSLLEELKRRKVVRAGMVYGAVAFAVVEAADVFVPALGLPEWILTAVAFLAILGFPLVLVLAWAFELTPRGLKRARDEDEELGGSATPWLTGRSAAVVALALAVGLAGGWMARSGGPDATGTEGEPTRSSIAVLPFPDLSAEGERSYLGDGIAEELLNILAQVPDLKVAGRTSSFSFRGRDVDLRQVGRELGVATVLEGSVRREGGRVRITAQLIDARDGFQIWSESYDRDVESLLEVQEEIASAIAQELRLPLQIGAGLRVRLSEDPEAYQTYLQGRAFLNNRQIRRAGSAFERAIARDSTFAAAWGGLAEAIALRPYFDLGTFEDALPAAEEAARRALELDSTLVSARVALANVLRDQQRWAAAEKAYRKVLETDPDDPEAVNQYAQFFAWVGRDEECLEWAQRAQELDPLSFVPVMVQGYALLNLRRLDEAEARFRQALAMAPGGDLAGNGLLYVYALRGELEKAREIAPEIQTRAPLDLILSAVENPELRPAVSDTLLARARELRGTGSAFILAQWVTLLGNRDQIFRALEENSVTNLFWRPPLDRYRDDSRFRTLLEEYDLPYES